MKRKEKRNCQKHKVNKCNCFKHTIRKLNNIPKHVNIANK